MHDIYGTETYLKYHSEELLKQAEHERQMRSVRRLTNYESSQKFGWHIAIRFTCIPDSRVGQIVIEGELK